MTKTFKRLLAGVLAVCMIVGLMPAMVLAADGATEITSLSQITDPSGNYKLAADIEENLTAPLLDGESFSGTLDGDGHYIKFTLEADAEWLGLFAGSAWGATVKNLELRNCTVVNSHDANSYTGLLFGYGYGAFLTNVVANNVYVEGRSYTGGLVGEEGYGTIKNCGVYTGTIKNVGNSNGDMCKLGGIVGRNNGTVEMCYNGAVIVNDDTVSQSNNCQTGGIAGENANTIQNCYNAGTVMDSQNMTTYTSGGMGGVTGGGSAYYSYNMGTVQMGEGAWANPDYCYAVSPYGTGTFYLEGCGGTSGGATALDAATLATYASSIGTDCWLNGDEDHPYPVLEWQTDWYDVNSNMPFTVKYWKQSDSENAVDGYEYMMYDDQSFRGVVGEEPVFTPRTYEGYVLNAEKSATDAVVAEGLVINLYYDAGTWTLTYNFQGETPINEGEYTPAGLVAYGTKLVMPQIAVGYNAVWTYEATWGTAEVREGMTMPGYDLTLTFSGNSPKVFPVTWDANGGVMERVVDWSKTFWDPTIGDWGGYNYVYVDMPTSTWSGAQGTSCGAGFNQRLGDYFGTGYDADWNYISGWGGQWTRELPVPVAAPEGYKFAGWVMGTVEEDSESTSGDLIVTLDPSVVYTADTVLDFIPEDGTLTFYAMWEEDPCSLNGHTLTAVEAQAPTCTEAGNIAYWTCTVCGDLFADAEGTTETTLDAVTLPALGHTWDEGTVTEPTCTEGGCTTFTCTVCGETNVGNETEALGHDWSDWTDNGDGTETRSCTRCDATETQQKATTKTVTLRTEVNNNTHFYLSSVEISSDLSDKYGYVDSVEGPSMLDAYIYAELLIDLNLYPGNDSWIYADKALSFNADATGKVTMFNSQPYTAFSINDVLMTDAAGSVALEDGMDILVYARSSKANYYLGVKGPDGSYGKTISTETLVPTKLTVMGAPAFATNGTVGESEYAVPMNGAGFVPYTVTTAWGNPVITGSIDSAVAVTDKTGAATITYTEPGTYQYVVTGTVDNLIMNTVTVVVTAHEHAPVLVPGTPATCTEDGTADSYKCACGKLFADAEGTEEITAPETLPALGHDWDEGVVTTPATEKTEGVMTFTCARCGETKTEAIPMIECPSAQFSDVPEGAWYHAAVDYVVGNGIMNGMGNGTFAPKGTMTRAQLAQVLYNLAGKPAVTAQNPFTDVKETFWGRDAIVWASANGIVNGVGGGKFDPTANVTRETVVVMLYRYAKAEPVSTNALASYPDANKVSSWAKEAMNWAVCNGFIKGDEKGQLNPRKTMTRAEVAQFMMNYLAN